MCLYKSGILFILLRTLKHYPQTYYITAKSTLESKVSRPISSVSAQISNCTKRSDIYIHALPHLERVLVAEIVRLLVLTLPLLQGSQFRCDSVLS